MNPARVPQVPYSSPVMERRTFLAMVSGSLLVAPLAAGAQPTGKVYRVGVLTPFSIDHSRRDGPAQAFFEELRKLGWFEGQNFVFDWPDSQGSAEVLPRLAEELVERRPDVILAGGLRAAQAAQAVTTTIPVVFAFTSDPVGNGLVESFARPGRNLTGLTDGNLERYPKMLQFLTEAMPEAKAVAYIGVVPRGSTPQSGSVLAKTLDRMQTAGRSLGVRVFFVGVGRIEEIESAFSEARRKDARVAIVFHDSVTHPSRAAIIVAAQRRALAVVAGDQRWAEAGALISFAPDWWAMSRRQAHFMNKILRGANPAALPVEDPTKFEVAVNLKTAKAFGIRIPPSLLLRADQVIE